MQQNSFLWNSTNQDWQPWMNEWMNGTLLSTSGKYFSFCHLTVTVVYPSSLIAFTWTSEEYGINNFFHCFLVIIEISSISWIHTLLAGSYVGKENIRFVICWYTSWKFCSSTRICPKSVPNGHACNFCFDLNNDLSILGYIYIFPSTKEYHFSVKFAVVGYKQIAQDYLR